MGLWSSCSSIGNIIGALIGGLILSFNQQWMVVFITFASFQVIIGVIYFVSVPDSPNKKINSPENGFLEISPTRSINDKEIVFKGHSKAMPFLESLKLPRVITYSLNYACVKSLNYGLSMWLPFFLDKRINKAEWIGTLAASLNIGAVIGSIICGWLGDYYKYRSPIIAGFLICSLPCLLLLQVGSESTV